MAIGNGFGDRELMHRIKRRLLDQRDPGLSSGTAEDKRLRLKHAVTKALEEDRVMLPGGEVAALVRDISDDMIGLGPLEALLRDPRISEVMINGCRDVYIERRGRVERANLVLESDGHVLHLIERVIGPLGLRVDESHPYVEARLSDGSRLHAIIPPLSVGGPAVTIRKFAVVPFTFADLVETATLTAEMAEFLDAAVRAKVNMIVSGGTGSGKTTLLNVLSASVPESERLITIEEAAELRLGHDNVVSLEARPPNIEGKGEVTVRQLVRNALRMRPDRIIVGEVRGGEALDMLQAMNTGHEGSLSTVHANSPHDLLVRLEAMVMMAELGLASAPIRQQIVAALDLIVHTARFPDGSRKVVKVTEVKGLDDDGLILEDVFTFERRGSGPSGKVAGNFKVASAPQCLQAIKNTGISYRWPAVRGSARRRCAEQTLKSPVVSPVQG